MSAPPFDIVLHRPSQLFHQAWIKIGLFALIKKCEQMDTHPILQKVEVPVSATLALVLSGRGDPRFSKATVEPNALFWIFDQGIHDGLLDPCFAMPFHT